MKRLLFLAALTIVAAPAHAADIGVSISIGQPGFYGRIDIGDYPRPQLIYPQPRYVYRAAAGRPPIYLHVPPGHAKNWRKHCRAYNACGERVYFVQESWYEREYVPRYQERHADRRANQRDERGDDRRAPHGNERGDDRRGHNEQQRDPRDHGRDR